MKNIPWLKVRRFKKWLCDRNLLLQSPNTFFIQNVAFGPCFGWLGVYVLGRGFLVVWGFFLMWLGGAGDNGNANRGQILSIHTTQRINFHFVRLKVLFILLMASQQILQNATKSLCSALQNAHQLLSSQGITHRATITPAAGWAAAQSDYFCLAK